MKKNENLKKILLLFVVFVILFLSTPQVERSIRRFAHLPVRDEDVQDSNSKLLSLLLDQNSFSDSWKWDLITTHQSSENPEYNKDISEYAIRKFAGVYDAYKVQILHSISRYDKGVPTLEPEGELSPIGILDILKTYNINTSYGDGSPATCYLGRDSSGNYVTHCILILIDSPIYERFNLDIYTNDDEVVLLVFNDFLKNIK